MKPNLLFLSAILFVFNFSTKSLCQNNLAPGDLAIVSYQSDFDPTNAFTPGVPEFEDRFSLVILKPGGIAAGTVIFFTTRGWNGSANTWHDVDFPPNTFGLPRQAVVQWTVPAGITQGKEVFFINTFHDELPAGSEYYSWAAYSNQNGSIGSKISDLANVTPIVPAANSTDGMSFPVSGGKLLVYQTGPPAGSNAGPNNSTIRFITALLANINGTTVALCTTTYSGWDAAPGVQAFDESTIPPGLINGQTCFLMSPNVLPSVSNGTSEPDNGKFSAGALSLAGACSALEMSKIIYATNPAGPAPTTPNWTYSNAFFPLGTSSSLSTYAVVTELAGKVYVDTDGGTINGTLLPASVTNVYISLFKSGNTTVPNQVAHVVNGSYSFTPVPDDAYTLVIGTSPSGSYTASFPSVAGAAMQASAEGNAGTVGDATPNGKGLITFNSCTPTYGNAKVNVAGSLDFGLKAVPLPVRLLAFEGNSTISGNELVWSTVSENNFSHFEIEKSIDAKEFAFVAKIKGSTYSKENLNYSYLDNNDQSASSTQHRFENKTNGNIYYRLKMVDMDGSHEFSNIIFVKNEFNLSVVGEFYPNPAINQEVKITINSIETANWIIKGFDFSGKLFSTQFIKLNKGENNVLLNLENSPTGISVFRIENKDGVRYRKLLR